MNVKSLIGMKNGNSDDHGGFTVLHRDSLSGSLCLFCGTLWNINKPL